MIQRKYNFFYIKTSKNTKIKIRNFYDVKGKDKNMENIMKVTNELGECTNVKS